MIIQKGRLRTTTSIRAGGQNFTFTRSKIFMGAIATCAITLAGCQIPRVPSLRQPDRIYAMDVEIDKIKSYEEQGVKSPFSITRAPDRNAFITARIYAIDLEYTNYESQLTHETQDINFGATAATLGLTTTASLIPVAHTSRALSAIAGGVTGLDTAYNEKVMLTKTIQNVQTQMRANRNEQVARIYSNMKCDIYGYPVGLALSDLETYYRAGTFTEGLISLSSTVNKAETESKTAKNVSSPAGPNVSDALALLKQAEAKITQQPCPLDLPPIPPPVKKKQPTKKGTG